MADADGPGGRFLVAMRGITKHFGIVRANASVDFDLLHGEIHALLGENGAGKTTLMNILSGFMQPDEGSIFVEGEPVRIRSPQDAIGLGIGMVHQHSELVPTFTVAENMLLGTRGRFRVTRAELDRVSTDLRELGEEHGLEVSPEPPVWQLSVGERQRAEVLRALYRSARVLILDEPTANLTPTEVEPLLEKLRGMARAGAAVVLITHHLDEVMACADRITVLRNGSRVGSVTPAETNVRELARLMVGRDVALSLVTSAGESPAVDPAAATPGPGEREAVLRVEGLEANSDRGMPALRGIDLAIRQGEIVAIAGVDGNGQAELEEALFALREATGGVVSLLGRDVTNRSPEELLKAGVGLVPSDRYLRGLVRSLSVAENLVLDRIDRPPFGTRLSLRPRRIMERCAELVRRFSIMVRSPRQLAGTLSGGHSQRVVLARALSDDIKVLIAAQPTRGLDVGAIEFVWDLLREQRERGVATLLISTDLDEVFALADRCHVIYKGMLVGHWTRGQLDREEIGLAMGGVVPGGGAHDRAEDHGRDG